VANLSYSGFYSTPDLEQNAELRILFRCYSGPLTKSVERLFTFGFVEKHRAVLFAGERKLTERMDL
jgi:hypothetical protein